MIDIILDHRATKLNPVRPKARANPIRRPSPVLRPHSKRHEAAAPADERKMTVRRGRRSDK